MGFGWLEVCELAFGGPDILIRLLDSAWLAGQDGGFDLLFPAAVLPSTARNAPTCAFWSKKISAKEADAMLDFGMHLGQFSFPTTPQQMTINVSQILVNLSQKKGQMLGEISHCAAFFSKGFFLLQQKMSPPGHEFFHPSAC